MELKVVCPCGQKYKFEVEPRGGRMPFTVACPVCGADGTQIAESMLARLPAAAPVAVALAMPAAAAVSAPEAAPAGAVASAAVAAPPAGAGLRLNKAAPPPPPPVPAAVAAAAAKPAGVPKYMQANATTQYNSFLLGIVGALLGAAVAVGFMVGTYVFFGFKFPLLGTIMGGFIGLGARLLYRGTDTTLGAMSAALSFVTIGVTLYLMFGIVGLALSTMSIVAGTMIGFRIAS